MDFSPPFGQWLKQRRKVLDLTQANLARCVHCAPVTVRKFESGQLRPSRQMAEQLADALDVSFAQRETFIAFARGLEPQGRRDTLPMPATSLVGRSQDLHVACQLLLRMDVRLLTLFGPPGVGKTRLAIELAHQVGDVFTSGVCFVALAPISDPNLVGSALATALGIKAREGQTPLERVTRYLQDKHLLLLLDNFEHLLPAAPLVSDLVAHVPHLKVLVTSRAVLRLSGECEVEVLPLPYPPAPTGGRPEDVDALAKYAAVELFVQRAHAAKPGFALTRPDGPAVAEICRRVDGLPLALELAAVRTRMFNPQTLLAHLDHHLGAAMGLLTVGPRDLPPRQQTLRATIDWSYQLLSDEEQALLRRLSVFAGGCILEAVQAVCGDERREIGDSRLGRGESPIDEALITNLQSLIDKSLVRQAEAEFAGEPRYVMLETIREYALEKLADADEATPVCAAHLDYFTRIGQDASPQFDGYSVVAGQVSLVKRLACDLDNVRRALEWAATEGHIDDALHLAEAWFPVFVLCDAQGEIEARLQGLLGHVQPNVTTPAQGWAYLYIGDVQARQDELDQASAALRQAEAIGLALDDPELRLAVKVRQIWDAQARGDYASAHTHVAQWRELVISRMLLDARAREIVEADLLGNLALAEGDYLEAQRLLSRHMELLDPANKNWLSTAARGLGYALLYQGQCAEAARWLRESLVDNYAMGQQQAVAACLAAFGALSVAGDDLVRAARLFGACEAITEAIHTPLLSTDVKHVHRNVAALRERLAGGILNAEWATGRAMTLEQAVEYALPIAPGPA